MRLKPGGRGAPKSFFGADRLFQYSVAAVACVTLIIVWGVVMKMISDAWLSIDRYGLGFIMDTTWNANAQQFGALPFIVGTLETSAIAVLVGVPLSLGIAVYLSELAPDWIRQPLAFVVELLAAVPSVIFGFWAMGVLRPVMVHTIEPALVHYLGWIPLFDGTPVGLDKLTAGLVLAVMIIPTVASLSKESMRSVPDSQREAALSLGATRYETTRIAVLSYARSGIFGATMLGLGRAIGETMAVAMTIGNSNYISWSLLDPGQTMASLIANNWGEADALMLSALLEIGVILFIVALLINVFARLMIRRVMKFVPATGAGL